MSLFKEEWRAEFVGGGVTGSKEDIKSFIEQTRREYGNTYTIHIQRRFVSDWKDVKAP